MTLFIYFLNHMSWFVLRIIAMVTMLTDHIGWNFIDNPMLLTWIWRIAFPCYAFLLAEWFFFVFKDRKRLLKHVSTLIMLAIISEPCYDLLEFGPNVLSSFMDSQSIMFTLILGFLWMSLTELLMPTNDNENNKVDWKIIMVLVCAYFLIGFTNYKIAANFNFVWPLLIIAYYRYLRCSRNEWKTENVWSWSKRFLALIWIFLIYLPIYFWVRCWFWDFSAWLDSVGNYLPWVWGHIVAAFILSLSNCKLWYHAKWFKYLYTFFYPLHALIIWIILVIMGS